jgi:hypothetical protein
VDSLGATYDARGLVELDGTVPKIAEIDGERAVLDARELSRTSRSSTRAPATRSARAS